MEFLEKNPNSSKISPFLIYKLVDKIIHDVRAKAKNTSKTFEKYRTDQLISGILNKIPKEQAHITHSFIDSLVHSANTMFELPTFYQRAVRHFLSNGLVEPEADSKHRSFDQDRLLVAMAAHRLYDGGISHSTATKIIDWVKGGEKHFSVKRLQREYGVSADGATSPLIECTNYDTMVVRGARILHKLQ